MQFFEILCIALGIASGALMPLLPDTKNPRRPIGVVSLFSLTLALAIFFLPVIATSPNFLLASTLMLVGGVIGFASVYALKSEMKQPATGATAKVTPAKVKA